MARRLIFGLIAVSILLGFAVPALGSSLIVCVSGVSPPNEANSLFEHEWPYPKKPFLERSSPMGPAVGDLENDDEKPAQHPQSRASLMTLVKKLQEPVQILRVHKDENGNETGLFRLTATAVSDNIRIERGVGIDDDKFSTSIGEEAEWKVEISLENPIGQSSSTVQSVEQPETQPQVQPEGWNGWEVTLLFGEYLTAEEIERSVYVPGLAVDNGDLTIEVYHSEPGTTRVRIIWRWRQAKGNRFLPGSHAYLALKVKTNGLPPRDQDLIFCDSINMEYNPVGSGYWRHVPLDPIYIKGAGDPHAEVSVTATRLDWRVQKPGTYAALATEISVTGYGNLQVQFSNFRDLARMDDVSGTIPAFYAFGQDLPDNASSQWIAASELNSQSNWLAPIELDPTIQSVVRLWSMISVSEEVSSAEYSSDRGDDKGVVTFIVSNN